MTRVFVSGAFDDARSPQLRFLQEASRFGKVTLVLWPDAAIAARRGTPAKMNLAERLYYFEALAYVEKVVLAPEDLDPDRLELANSEVPNFKGAIWAVLEATDAAGVAGAAGAAEAATEAVAKGHDANRAEWCRSRGLELRTVPASVLGGFPYEPPAISVPPEAGKKRVVATGCYDWLHSGHLRFFEEASEYGELNVIIGSDANVRLLKGEGHPLYNELERRFVVGSFKHVARCLISSGSGWLDAEPEIRALKADRYIVNEDGDKNEKRDFCAANAIEYIVLKRVPKTGLPRRSSTDLRGF